MIGRRGWLLATLAVAVAFTTSARAAKPKAEAFPDHPPDAQTLLRALATVEGLEAQFVERKHLALLKAPLESKGHLYYTRPGHMARIIDTPSPSTVRIGPTSLEVNDASGKQAFDLRRRPDVKMFVESFVHVVAGDRDALASTYAMMFEPAAAADETWRFTLTPRQAPLSDLVARLVIEGSAYAVASIVVHETSGDRTEIEMSDVDPKRRFTAEERARFFGLPPAK
jgi:outer membrane lipoprotein-sorting protein